MKELTKAEEQIMQVLWEIEKGFVKDILVKLPSPKPAYNTVSTITRILEKKGFVEHKAYGKTHEYYPAVTKEDYTKSTANKMLRNYFDGSVEQLISFFVKEKNLSVNDLDEILRSMDENKKQ